MKKLFLLIAFLSPLAAFCQCKYESGTVTSTYPPTDPNKVMLYSDNKDVPAKAEVLGTIVCNTDKETKIIPKSRELAAERGGTGLYYESFNEKDGTGKGIQKLIPKTRLIVVRVKNY